METIEVRVSDLLAKLRENREHHRQIFEEAVEGYRTRAVGLLEEHIDRIKNGKLEQVNVILPKPEDHTRDYDRAIAMLEMTQGAGTKTIDISAADFTRYVQDDWHWKREWVLANSMYAASIDPEEYQ